MLGLQLIRNIKGSFTKSVCFSMSHSLKLDLSWRTSKKLPLNPMDRGILTDGADYVFLDGRPTPFGTKQKRKILLQREYAKKIIELSESLDIAKERYAKKIGENAEETRNVLNKKLIPKGNKNLVNK